MLGTFTALVITTAAAVGFSYFLATVPTEKCLLGGDALQQNLLRAHWSDGENPPRSEFAGAYYLSGNPSFERVISFRGSNYSWDNKTMESGSFPSRVSNNMYREGLPNFGYTDRGWPWWFFPGRSSFCRRLLFNLRYKLTNGHSKMLTLLSVNATEATFLDQSDEPQGNGALMIFRRQQDGAHKIEKHFVDGWGHGWMRKEPFNYSFWQVIDRSGRKTSLWGDMESELRAQNDRICFMGT